MNNYQSMIKQVTNVILEKMKSFILVGDNSSGKSEILQEVIQLGLKQDVHIYFIDSVNRTFKVEDVRLSDMSYQNEKYDLGEILSTRLNPSNFNLKDTFGMTSSIESLYVKYEKNLKEMFREFVGKEISIKKQKIEEFGMEEKVVIVDQNEVKLSSGYQAILRLFSEILFFTDKIQENNWGNGVLVIDEIDEYLSPRYSAQILNYLKNRFRELDFLVTTHSLELAKSTKNVDLIVIGDATYNIYIGKQLEDDLLVEDIFSELFFKESEVAISSEDFVDKKLRRLLNLKITKMWTEKNQKELEELQFDEMSPHQQIIYKQIEEW